MVPELTTMVEKQKTKAEPIRKGRKGNIKVRTGCVTCKIRHLKCDEAKPVCGRCSFALRTCTWLAPPDQSLPKTKSKPQPKALLPREASQETAQRPPSQPRLSIEPGITLFSNDQESWYFKLYATETYKELSGAFHTNFWKRIVLQSAHGCSFIRSAVIAIGSLASQAKKAIPHPTGFFDAHEKPITERRFALSHYQRFIQGTRTQLHQNEQDLRLALISCLLIICIENLQWHHYDAMNSVFSGAKLLNDWLRNRPLSKRADSVLSPAPLVVEDGIIEQMNAYDAQTSWLCDPRPYEEHRRLMYQGQNTVDNMPASFVDVQEARMFFELIYRRIHHFIVSVRPTLFQMPQMGDAEKYNLFIDMNPNHVQIPLTMEEVAIQKAYYQEITRWEQAFSHLTQAVTADSPEFVGINVLRIRSRLLPILLIGQLSDTEMIYDNFVDNFRDIVTFSKMHMSHPKVWNQKYKGVYSLHTGLTFPLHLTSVRCRDRQLRRDAIDLLTKSPWREGIMVSFTSGMIGSFLMRVEEEGLLPHETITDDRRAILLRMYFKQKNEIRQMSIESVKYGDPHEMRREVWEWGVADKPCSANGLEVVSVIAVDSERRTRESSLHGSASVSADGSVGSVGSVKCGSPWAPTVVPWRLKST